MIESEILKAYPDLEREDIREALRYAAEAVQERELPVSGATAVPPINRTGSEDAGLTDSCRTATFRCLNGREAEP